MTGSSPALCASVCARPDRERGCGSPEDCCRAYLEELRWPGEVTCVRCGSSKTARLTRRKKFECRSCGHQFSVTSSTAMHRSHAPLWKWFLAVRLLVDSENGVPANQLHRRLGGSYKTAWFIEHRVRAAMLSTQEHQPVPLPSGTALRDGGRRVYAREVVGPYHQHGLDYLAAYQAETEWRFRQSGNPRRIDETLRVLIDGEPLSYEELVQPSRRRSATANGHSEALDHHPDSQVYAFEPVVVEPRRRARSAA